MGRGRPPGGVHARPRRGARTRLGPAVVRLPALVGPPRPADAPAKRALVAVAVAAAEGAAPRLGEAFWEASYAVLWLAVVALVVLVLSLYRQVGVLHLRLGPRGALEEEGEGPELGAQVDHPAVPARPRGARRVHVGRLPGVPPDRPRPSECSSATRRWPSSMRRTRTTAARSSTPRSTCPGTPYAVYLDASGVVRAKGTVNTLEQLESLVAAGGSRARDAAVGDVA